MTTSNIIKQQRDRFLAFSFASADLFIETAPDGKILFALGAAKGLTGIEDDELVGKDWLELFSHTDHAELIAMQKSAKQAMRCGPLLVKLNDNLVNRKGIVTAIKMPGSEHFYITLALGSALLEKLAVMIAPEKDPEPITTGFKATDEQEESITTGFIDAPDTPEPEAITTGFAQAPDEIIKSVTTGFKASDDDIDKSAFTTGFSADDDEYQEPLTTKDDFIANSEKAFDIARVQNIEAALTVFDFGDTDKIAEEHWTEIIGEISDYLQEQSIGGQPAAELGEGKYSVLHDEKISAGIMEEKISAITKEIDPDGEGLDISSKTIKTDLSSLSSQEATRALFYTINEFEKSGTDLTIESLNAGFKTFVSANSQKLQEFKNVIERVDFDIHFQPIVNLETKAAKHYEVLSRFGNGDTQEWIMFGEDVGLISKFDLAVVERTMNFIHYKAGTTRTKFSVNISGKSIEDAEFFEQLQEQLERRDYANRIMFEITESSRITDLKKVGRFIGDLQSAGYEIALDDFGAGAASFEYLQRLNVNYVKIDGKYVRNLLKSNRDEVMIRNLVKMCKDLGTKTIAEFVEEDEQAELLQEIGIDYGQGHLFGKARPKPDYVPPAS